MRMIGSQRKSYLHAKRCSVSIYMSHAAQAMVPTTCDKLAIPSLAGSANSMLLSCACSDTSLIKTAGTVALYSSMEEIT